MSNGQESWYAGGTSTLLRSSIDFFPKFPESHGAHLYANAQVGVWFGNFMQPDWDMFQSGHEWGAFHAAARAVSGGPVYVSDKPGQHDFELLRQLVCRDGSVLRCDLPGVPTVASLCRDPTREDVLLQIRNRVGAGIVLGIFNCQSEGGAVEDEVHLSEVLDEGVEYACYRHQAGTLERVARTVERRIALLPGRFELFTMVPIADGFAALGLLDKFNSHGAVAACSSEAGLATVELRDGGRFVGLSERAPSRVDCGETRIAFEYDAASSRLSCQVPDEGPSRLTIAFD
jgi:raffinose synthase